MKIFMILAILAVLSLGATVTFQALEMQEYNLWNTLHQRFFAK